MRSCAGLSSDPGFVDRCVRASDKKARQSAAYDSAIAAKTRLSHNLTDSRAQIMISSGQIAPTPLFTASHDSRTDKNYSCDTFLLGDNEDDVNMCSAVFCHTSATIMAVTRCALRSTSQNTTAVISYLHTANGFIKIFTQ